MAPMTRCRCDSTGLPSSELIEYYVSKAEAGISLIIIESCAVNNTDAKGYVNGCQLNQISHALAWKPVIERIKRTGAKVWVQLFHAGRLSVPEICGQTPLAPSPLKPAGQPSFWRPVKNGNLVHFQTNTEFVQPDEMTEADIERVISNFAYSCELALMAGFDGIELHGAHGYLLHQFCSKFSNLREDEYSIAENYLFASRTVKACRNIVPPGVALSYRLSFHMIDNYYLDYSDIDIKRLVPVLEKAGVSIFHSSELRLGEVVGRSPAPLSSIIKNSTDKPVIGCGRIQSLQEAQSIINKHEYIDLIAFGRALLIQDFVPDEASGIAFDYEQHFQKI